MQTSHQIELNLNPTTKEKELTSNWRGSIRTLSMVAKEIENRFGVEAVKIYDPTVNCFTFNGWEQRGYRVKKGEKAIKSVTFIGATKTKTVDGVEKKEDYSYCKTVNLFFISQVEKREC